MHRTAFSYYGGKGLIVGRYPKPKFKTIVEPFAGGAAYSLRYYKHNVILYEINKNVFDMWKFLISEDALLWIKWIPKKVKAGDKIDKMINDVGPVPNGLVWYLRSAANIGLAGTNKVINTITTLAEKKWKHNLIDKIKYWNPRLRHWIINNKSYHKSINVNATWFIDPPYSNAAGKLYKYHDIDYYGLSLYAKSRKGQLIVCENEGAKWLPFKSMEITNGVRSRFISNKRSCESMYHSYAQGL